MLLIWKGWSSRFRPLDGTIDGLHSNAAKIHLNYRNLLFWGEKAPPAGFRCYCASQTEAWFRKWQIIFQTTRGLPCSSSCCFKSIKVMLILSSSQLFLPFMKSCQRCSLLLIFAFISCIESVYSFFIGNREKKGWEALFILLKPSSNVWLDDRC